MTRVGEAVLPIDWEKRTRGAAGYVADILPAGTLRAAVLRSAHPHAEIVELDASDAEAMPGVRAVITFADFPPDSCYPCYGTLDRPPLARSVVHFVGQEIAAVAADTQAEAEAAVAKIKVRYRPLSSLQTVTEALSPNSIVLHPSTRDGAVNGESKPPNVRRSFRNIWGDPQDARSAELVVTHRYGSPPQNQCCMEPHSALAEWRDGRLHMWTPTTTPLIIKGQLAHVLGIEPDRIVIHEVAVGGSFGAKIQLNGHEALAAALSKKSGQPVYLALKREEEFETNYSRHGFDVFLTVRGDKTGDLRSFEAAISVDNGAFIHSGNAVMGASALVFGEAYDLLGADVSAQLVDTNKVPGGAMRGYGGPQTTFARESGVDELAAACGIDPLELRLRNVYGSHRDTLAGHVGSNGTTRCLEAVREEIGWDRERTRADQVPGRGVGVSVGEHLSGAHTFPNSNRADSTIDIRADGTVTLRHGGGDAGTGQNTILAQIVAQELGVSWDRIKIVSMDTDLTPMEWGAWSSRGTHYSAHSVRLTAQTVADRLRSLAQSRMGRGSVALEDNCAVSGKERIPIGELVELSNEAVDGVLTQTCSFVDPNVEMYAPGKKARITATHNFAAHAAIIQADPRTGKIKVCDYVAAHDSGTVLNPLLMDGQVRGAIGMGIGGALGEEMIFEQGKLVNPAFLHYALPRAADLPRVRIRYEGMPDENGPYGAKGAGELGVNPVGAVLANALYDALGIRVRSLPLTPDKIVNALAKKEGRQRRFGIWRRPDRWWIELVRRLYPLGLFKILHRRQLAKHDQQTAPAKPPQEVLRPRTPQELVSALGADAALIGGGTDLQLLRRQQIIAPGRLVSVGRVDELRRIDCCEDGSLVIGAGVKLSVLEDYAQRIAPALAAAISEIASPQVRNVATVAGNLAQQKRCWFFRNGFNCYKRRGPEAPCYAILGDHRFYHAAIDGHRCQAVTPSDLATIFTAFDATVRIGGPGGIRDLDISRLYNGPGEVSISSDEAILSVRIPPSALRRKSAFKKLNLWQGDFAVASVALSLDIDASGRCSDARLVLGAVGPTPLRMIKTEKALAGADLSVSSLRQVLDQELDSRAHPLARNGWKLDAAAGLAEHALEEIFQHLSSGESTSGLRGSAHDLDSREG